ncbi:hypothetical protein CNO08_19415 [Lysobacter capsici]|nr:hypothetical protein CNO08_19415 [Lysobacter capsici]
MDVEIHRFSGRSRVVSTTGLRRVLAVAIACAIQVPAWAACSNNAPVSGETVSCDSSAPNPQTTGIVGGAGVDSVVVNIQAGSEISVIPDAGELGITAVGNAWRINNSGSIVNNSLSSPGAIRIVGADTKVDNSGSIRSRTTAIELGARGELTNSGDVYGEGTAIKLGSDGRVINRGDIRAARFSGISFQDAGQLVNEAGATITSDRSTAVHGTNGVQIDNRGIIQGETAVGVDGGDSRITNYAGGLIESRVSDHYAIGLSGGNDTIVNNGTIKASNAISFGAGDDSLTMTGGSVLEGRVDGGEGNDRLRLEGGNSLALASFHDFENIQAAADSRWTLSGAMQSATSALSFDIGERAQLDLAGTVGATALTKFGVGVLRISGDSAANTGAVSLNAGTLIVDGALGGDVRVASGAALSGVGRVGAVNNAGTLAPGNSLGTLSITGDYLQQASGILQVDVDASGASDLLRVGGKATLQGGRVDVVKAPGQYVGGTRYTLVDASGGISGQFAQLTQNLPFLDLLLSYDAQHVYLDVARNRTRYVDVCSDFNQCQSATLIDAISVRQQLGSDTQTVLNELSTLDVGGARSALLSLSGNIHASFANVLVDNAAERVQTLSRRLLERRGSEDERHRGGAGWVQAFGGSGQLDSEGAAHGADYKSRGIAIGVDAWLNERWLLGASVHAGNLDADFARGDRGEADTRGLSLYGGYSGARFYVDGAVSYSHLDNEMARSIRVGSIQRRAGSEYDGESYGVSLEAGINVEIGASLLQPLLSVEVDRIKQDAFRETGAADLDLLGDSLEVERTTAGLGARWSYRYEGDSWRLEPAVQARWLSSSSDRYAELDAALAGAPELSFRSRGLSVPADRSSLGLGLRARRGQNLELQFAYEFQHGDRFKSQNGSVGLRWAW